MLKTTLALLTLLPSISIAQPSIRVLKISIDQPVYTNQPLWIRAEATPSNNIQYPFRALMEDIGCNQLEVKRDGVLLKPHPISGIYWGGLLCGTSAPSGSPNDRLPLHVLYSLDQPGTYSVRWTVGPKLPNSTAHEARAQSEWLTFEVKQATPQQHEAWIQAMLANPPTDSGMLAGDYLSSLLAAAPDPRVLQVFVKYLHAQDPMVSGMAASGIERFPLSEVLPAVTESIEHDGPGGALAGFATSHFGWTHDQQVRIVHAVIPYLQPASVLPSYQPPSYARTSVSSAIAMLRDIFYIPNHVWPEDPQLTAYADSQVLLAAPNIMNHGNERAVQELAEYLGSMQPSTRAHELLLEIAQRTDNAGKQAQICLNWHRP